MVVVIAAEQVEATCVAFIELCFELKKQGSSFGLRSVFDFRVPIGLEDSFAHYDSSKVDSNFLVQKLSIAK